MDWTLSTERTAWELVAAVAIFLFCGVGASAFLKTTKIIAVFVVFENDENYRGFAILFSFGGGDALFRPDFDASRRGKADRRFDVGRFRERSATAERWRKRARKRRQRNGLDALRFVG